MMFLGECQEITYLNRYIFHQVLGNLYLAEIDIFIILHEKSSLVNFEAFSFKSYVSWKWNYQQDYVARRTEYFNSCYNTVWYNYDPIIPVRKIFILHLFPWKIEIITFDIYIKKKINQFLLLLILLLFNLQKFSSKFLY
jgi:hypothetical protein